MSVSSVSCTYCIDMVCICNDANSTAPSGHRGDHCPLVGLWAVIFTGLQALVPIETTTNVNLGRTGGALSYLTLFSTSTGDFVSCINANNTEIFLHHCQMISELQLRPNI